MEQIAEHNEGLSIGAYLATLKRRRLLVARVMLPILTIGAAVALALPDYYQSTATFRLVSDRVAETEASRNEFVDQYVFAVSDKVLSSSTLNSIVKKFNLYPDLVEDGDTSRAAEKLRSNTRVSMVQQKVLLPQAGRDQVINIGFTLVYRNPSPEMAEKVAAALTDVFVAMGRSDQLAAATDRVGFFSGESERLSRQIAEFEGRLASFKSANFDRLPEAAQANFAIRGRLEQELDGAEREIRTLQQNRVFVVQQLRQAQAGPAAGNLRQLEDEYARKSATYAETHPDMVALRRQIESLRRGGAVSTGNSLQAQIEQQRAILAEARQRYSEDHPDIRKLVRNIESLEARIAAGEGGGGGGAPSGGSDTLMSVQLQTQLNALDTQIAGLQARAGTLRARLIQLDEQIGGTPEVEREYQEITRGIGSAREQFNQMTSKRLDADLEVAAINTGAADRFRLLKAPSVPLGPAGPPRAGIVVAAVLLSLMVAFGALVAAEVLDTSVRGARDVRSLFGQTPLALVPRIRNSVYRRTRYRAMVWLAGSVVLGGPLVYLVVRLAAG